MERPEGSPIKAVAPPICRNEVDNGKLDDTSYKRNDLVAMNLEVDQAHHRQDVADM